MKNVAKLMLLGLAALAVTAVPTYAGATIATPEPTSILLLASGIGSVMLIRRFRK